MGIDTARVVHSELLDDSLRDLVCVVCSDLIDPHDALQGPCGHVFCSSCILKYLDGGHSDCPLDKKSLKHEELRALKEANPLVYRLLGRTSVRCENFKAGCNWRGELFDSPTHMKQCRTQERHCECCQVRTSELKAAKELIVGYERLVNEYKKDISSLKEKVTQLEAQLMTRSNDARHTSKQASAGVHQLRSASPATPSSSSLPLNSLPGSETASSPSSWQQLTMALPTAPPLSTTWTSHETLCMASSLGGGVPASTDAPYSSNASRPGRQREETTAVVSTAAALGQSNLGGDRHGKLSAPTSHSAEFAHGRGGLPGPAGSTLRSAPALRSSSSHRSPVKLPRQPWQGGIFSMTLFGHNAQVTAMSTSPDGRLLFSGSLDGNLRVWHAGKCIFSQADFHNGCIWSLAYAADSDTLYSCGEDKAVKAWPAIVRSIVEAEGRVQPEQQGITVEDAALMGPMPLRVCYAGCGRLVVAYSDGRVLARENLRLAHVLREKGPCTTTLDLVANDSGTVFFSGNPEHHITMCTWSSKPQLLVGHESEVAAMAVGPGNVLLSLSKDGMVKEWRDGSLSNTWVGWRVPGKFALGHDGTIYCGRERDRIVQCRRGGTCVYTLLESNVCKEEALVLAIGTDGILYSGERGGAIRMWRCPE